MHALKIFTAARVVEDRCKIVNAQLVQLAQCVKWDAAAASSVHSVHLFLSTFIMTRPCPPGPRWIVGTQILLTPCFSPAALSSVLENDS